MGKAVCDAMKTEKIPFTWLKDAESKRQFDVLEDSVKVITMHSSKGLEFPTVAACGVGSLGGNEERVEDDAKLLYVAMTRATQNLLVTSSKESSFTVKLQEMIKKQKAEVAA
jgi:superfamily I DNA/RNA helicase